MNKNGGNREIYYSTDLQRPLISIIIVTLNAAAHIEACLQSIVRQKYKNIEIIVFDGESSDDTISILLKYDKWITYWQSEPDNGVYDAMNKSIKHAKGQWVYFLGADDQLLDGFTQLASELTNNHTIYYGDMSYNGEATSRRKYNAYRLAKETICHQAIIYPRVVFDHYSYNLSYPIAADWALNLQLWGDKRFKFAFYPYVIANFSLSGISSLNKDHNFLNDQPTLIKKYLGIGVYLRFILKKVKRLILTYLFLSKC